MTKQNTKQFSVELVIPNKLGLHARAAAILRECAQKFKSDIKIVKDHMEANAKSLLGLIALGAAQGSTIKITTEGVDAKEAVKSLRELVENGFGEEE